MLTKFGIILVLLAAAALDAYELPPTLEICNRTSSNLNECTINAVYTLKKYLVNGIAEKNIDSIDPMMIDNFEIKENESSQNRLFNLNQKYKNVAVTGFGDFTIKDIRVDFTNKCKIQAKAHMPRMVIFGDYEIDGKLMIFTIKGHGKANLTFNDVGVKMQLNCNFIENMNLNEMILNIKSFAFVLNPKFVNLDFENLFDGNPDLSETVGRFLNDNSLTIFDELKAGYQNIFNHKFLIIANKLLNDIPISKLFTN